MALSLRVSHAALLLEGGRVLECVLTGLRDWTAGPPLSEDAVRA